MARSVIVTLGANVSNFIAGMGQAATAAQYGAFQLGNQFFALMLDPLVYGRGGSLIASGAGFGAGPGGAMRLAPPAACA